MYMDLKINNNKQKKKKKKYNNKKRMNKFKINNKMNKLNKNQKNQRNKKYLKRMMIIMMMMMILMDGKKLFQRKNITIIILNNQIHNCKLNKLKINKRNHQKMIMMKNGLIIQILMKN